MRIHTDTLTTQFVTEALAAECRAGRIADSVGFKMLRTHRSHVRARGIEIQLMSTQPGHGRRVGNSGSYGAMRADVDGYAATYDEWGWLLSAMFRADPAMIVGTAAHPTYADREDFNHKTGLTYDPWAWYSFVMEWPPFADERDPYPIITGKAVGTRRGYVVGRRGFGRHALEGFPRYWPHEERPRTVAEVLEFAHLTAEDMPRTIASAVSA